MIEYPILETYIIRILWKTVRRITNEIWVEGLTCAVATSCLCFSLFLPIFFYYIYCSFDHYFICSFSYFLGVLFLLSPFFSLYDYMHGLFFRLFQLLRLKLLGGAACSKILNGFLFSPQGISSLLRRLLSITI